MYASFSKLPSPSLLLVILSACPVVFTAQRTSPPSGAVVVRAGTTASGEFSSVMAAVNSLPNDYSWRSIFVYPGTYNEQVLVSRNGPLTIYGYTTDTMNYAANQATIQANVTARETGSDDGCSTFRVHQDHFAMYNMNVKNTFGQGAQAVAFSQYGNRVGLYACGLYGYQDTLLADYGAQVYLRGYIEGAVDFIWGQAAMAYFGGNTIGLSGSGWITASGRSSKDESSFVFDKTTIILTPGTKATWDMYLGRPWEPFAKVIFKHTVVEAPLNRQVWSAWDAVKPANDLFFAEYNTTGRGVKAALRPGFVKVLRASQAAAYSISSAVGSDYATWVDTSYLV